MLHDVAIRSYANGGAADIANQRNTKAARNTLPPNLHRIAVEKLILLDAASRLGDLRAWPSLRLEKLKGDRRDQHSIRINDQYRICFVWREPDAYSVQIIDYH
jgi:proteic killer suppression protein